MNHPSNRSPPAAGHGNGGVVTDFVSPATHTNNSHIHSGGGVTKRVPSSTSPLPSGNGGSHHTAPSTTTTPSINSANKCISSGPSSLLHPTTASTTTSPIHFIRIVPSSSPSDVTASLLNSRFQRRGGGGASPGTASTGHNQLLHPLSASVPPGQVTKPPLPSTTVVATRTQFVQTDVDVSPTTAATAALVGSEVERLEGVLESMERSMHTLHSQHLPVHGVVNDMKNTLHQLSTAAAAQHAHRQQPPTTVHDGATQTDSIQQPTTYPPTTQTSTMPTSNTNTTATTSPSHQQHPLLQLLCLTTHLRDKAVSKGIT